MTALVREARPADRDAIARVLLAAFVQYRPPRDAPVSPLHRAAVERYLEDVADVADRLALAEVFVAERHGTIVGTATLYGPGQATDYAVEQGGRPWPDSWAVLRYLGVDPRARGLGIGRLLAIARIERARAIGAPFAALHVAERFAASRAMYRAMGWQRAPAYDFSPVVDTPVEGYVLPLHAAVKD